MYIRLSDNFYPLAERDIRAAFPNTSFPEPFNPEGYAVVFTVPQPAYDYYTQVCREIAPELTDKGTWQQVWQVIDLTGEDLAAGLARKAADRLRDCESALETMLDAKARERTWKDCMSARTAAGYPSSFQAEGVAFVVWWDECWVMAHTILAEVQAGTRPIPTVEEFLAEMPNLILPE
jgi:hypothetical protein